MSDVAELKRFVAVHARAQSLPHRRCAEILVRIDNDDDGRAGSWAVEWTRAADRMRAANQPLTASRYYNIARFPYVDGPVRRDALESCVASFDEWRSGTPIRRLDIPLRGGLVRCWTIGLTPRSSRPLLVMLGGIVSIKEQWAPVLLRLARLGMAGIVTEMPGVGENTLPYDEGSPLVLSAILDAVAGQADVTRTYLAAMSFSGHLALRRAADDPRIRGIVTAGPPVSAFFTDKGWQARLPGVTAGTLAHLLGVPAADVPERIRGWELTDDELGALDIPVHCMVSRRDEIIPPGDVAHLRRTVRDLHVIENDDVHGSPRHAAEARLWVALSLLRMRRARGPATALLGVAHAALRLRGKLPRPTRTFAELGDTAAP